MNHRYVSAAIEKDGTPEPAFARDKELYYSATSWPGAHLPHLWLDRRGERISTLDLCGKGRFTLLTGIGGEAWVAAAVSKAMGAEIAACVMSTFSTYETVGVSSLIGLEHIRPVSFRQWLRVVCGGYRDAGSCR